MARVDSLGHFLTDVADAIREKGGTSEPIQASDFDTEIENLPSGGGDLSEYFTTEITNNTSDTISLVKKYPDIVVSDNVTTISSIFYGYNNSKNNILPNIKFNNNVITASTLYYQCSYIESVDMSGWDITNLTDISNCFYNCQRLTNIISPNTTSTQPIQAFNMFYGLSNVINLDLSNLKINKIRNAQYMFRGCSNLKSLDIRNLKLDDNYINTNIAGLFYDCRQLTHIDMRNLDIAGSTIGVSTVMFNNVPTNCEIIVKDNANKTWMNNNYSSMTNVKTVAEYEAE